ncbi:discoidin domain-containing protein [Lysinibacillus sp. NPDC093210]|uniref:discoidin domain-containing protein n=1 Tax=Lysinibacillus sp. NPDC093210 TaxID=3364133 RepID=UPI00380C910F
MANLYLKVEGSGGGSSGSGMSSIEVYDQKGSLVQLTKNHVVETNAIYRTDDIGYLHMLQTKGSLPPYNTNSGGIYYTIKLPEYIKSFAKIFLKNWGNSSYDIRNIKISISYDNISYEQIYYDTLATNEEKVVLQNYSPLRRYFLFRSNYKIHSLLYSDEFEPLIMTSYNTPSPYVITSSGDFNSGYSCWKAFNNTNSGSGDSWITTSGIPLGWIQVNFGTSKRYNKISFTTRDYSDSNITSPKEFKILGSNDNLVWTELSLIENQTNWKQNETRIYEFNNSKAYQYYRLQITVANSSSYSAIGKLIFGYRGLSLLNLNNNSERSFSDYGVKSLKSLNIPIGVVCYVLQDSEKNTLTTKQLDKKPLSIRFN